MTTQAESLGAGSLTRFAEITHNGLTEMRGATAPRLLLELLCARMLLPAAAEGEAAVLHRLERLERRFTIAPRAPDADPGHSPAPADVVETMPTPPPRPPQPSSRPARPADPPVALPPAPEAQREAAPAQLDAAAVRRAWPALLDAVREQSRTTQVLLSNATASAVQGCALVLNLPNAPLARRLGEERNVELIKAALRTVLGVEWQVRCEHVGGDAGIPSAQVQPQKPAQRTRPPDRPASRRPAAQGTDDDVPPPPEPPVDDDEAMLAEAAGMSREHSTRRDPEEVALALLAEQLGARRIDEG